MDRAGFLEMIAKKKGAKAPVKGKVDKTEAKFPDKGKIVAKKGNKAELLAKLAAAKKGKK